MSLIMLYDLQSKVGLKLWIAISLERGSGC